MEMEWELLDRLHQFAEAGDAKAQFDLAACYCRQENQNEAIKWLQKASQKVFPELAQAQWQLGVWYFYGKGIDEDKVKAVELFRESANKDFALAQIYLGRCYYEGIVEQQNHKEAARWLRKAAEDKPKEYGQALAQYYLGKYYLNGNDEPPNLEEAKKWFRMAADQGLQEAEEMLQRLEEKKV